MFCYVFSPTCRIHLIIQTGWCVESHYTSLPALLLSSAANIPPLLDFTSEHQSHPPRCSSAIIQWHNPAKVVKFFLSLWLGWSGQLVLETKISKTRSCTSWSWRFSCSLVLCPGVPGISEWTSRSLHRYHYYDQLKWEELFWLNRFKAEARHCRIFVTLTTRSLILATLYILTSATLTWGTSIDEFTSEVHC